MLFMSKTLSEQTKIRTKSTSFSPIVQGTPLNEGIILRRDGKSDINKMYLKMKNKLKANDTEAMKLFTKACEPFVKSVAKKFLFTGFELEELMQEGQRGILITIKKHSSDSIKFSTYAMYWVRQSIRRFCQDHGDTIRVPAHQHERIAKFNKLHNKFRQKHRREPTKEETQKLRNRMHLTDSQHSAMNSAIKAKNTASLDQTLNEDEDSSLKDFVVGEQGIQISDPRLQTLIDRLPEKERLAFQLYFEDGKTLEEISKVKEFKVSRERVRQLKAKALRRLQLWLIYDPVKEKSKRILRQDSPKEDVPPLYRPPVYKRYGHYTPASEFYIKSSASEKELLEVIKNSIGKEREMAVLYLTQKAQITKSTINSLIQMLVDEKFIVTLIASDTLTALCKKHGNSIIRQLKDNLNGCIKIRSGIADVFGKIKNKSTVPLLINLLDDRDGYVRSSAASALLEFNDEKLAMKILKDRKKPRSQYQPSLCHAVYQKFPSLRPL